MKTAAVIAEYNPFHKGHHYQLSETRRRTGADFILVVMSGDFVQRGAPAIAGKYIRTRMALLGGADAVIELPALYALSSAEFFAGGAVTLLDNLQAANTLSFGSETGSLALLESCAHTLLHKDHEIRSLIQSFMKEGCSYPSARLKALSKVTMTESGGFASSPDYETLAALLSSPNNILGLEYCKSLYAVKSSIRPFTLRREDQGYHDTSLTEASSPYVSASAIRKALSRKPEEIKPFVPEAVFDLLVQNKLLTSPVTEEDFSELLYYKLLMEKEQGFCNYLDCTPDLSHKICKNLSDFKGFTEFCRLLKSKELTYTRISRVLMHILLNIKTPSYFQPDLADRSLFVPYARLLGFRKSASPLLSSIKKNSRIPLISKPADARRLLTDEAFDLFTQDILCASVYEAVTSRLRGMPAINEWKQSPIILP